MKFVPLTRNPLKRYYGRGDLHFVTFSCYRRLSYLSAPEARDYVVQALNQVRFQKKFLLLGYVVMLQHVHLLVSEPLEKNLSKALQVLKQRTSRTLLKTLPNVMQYRSERKSGEVNEDHFWQPRFYDFNIWSEGKFHEKLKYMHANPVEKKLVLHPKDWPWSSWSFYTTGEPGMIPIDSLRK